MMTYQQLTDLRLGSLQTAATEWHEMVQKLEKIANGGDGGTSAAELTKKAKSANWEGKNAAAAKEFVTTLAGEFDDVVTSARSVQNILDGAHKQFKQHKQDLRDIVANAKKKNIYVDANGRVIPEQAPGAQATQSEIDGIAAAISKVLGDATDTDRIAAEALNMHSADKHDFRSKGFKSFDAAQQAIRGANELIQIVTQNTGSLSNEQLKRINELLVSNALNPMFGERVITGMKPQEFLEFYGQASNIQYWMDRDNTQGTSSQRMELLSTLEFRLGTTLGDATFSDSSAMNKWMDQAIRAGGNAVGGVGVGHTRIYGFQAMSNLMRHGTYEQHFLVDYGNALIQFEKENTEDIPIPGPRAGEREDVLPWNHAPLYSRPEQLHFGLGSENDAGLDPMTGFMKALSHNPGAATEFFGQEAQTKYVLQDRQAFTDIVPEPGETREDYQGPTASWEATGEALVAGATGMDPWDDAAPNEPHTAGQKEALRNSLEYLAPRGDSFPPELRDDMATVLVNHGSDVHASMSDLSGDPPLNREQLMEVAKQVSRDKESYVNLSMGMNFAIEQDFKTETENPEDSLTRAGRTVGFLEEVRYQVIEGQAKDEITDAKWQHAWTFNGAQAVANLIPGHVDDLFSRGAYMVSFDMMQEEIDRINEEAVGDYQETFNQRQGHLTALADRWYHYNSDWAEAPHRDGYSRDYGIYNQIGESANDGNMQAEGLAGNQE